MAPECTSNLVVLDLRRVKGKVECDVDRLDRAGAAERFHVSWNATAQPDGTDPIGNGVIYVWRPPGYYRRRYHSKPDEMDGGFSWIHPVEGELMVVLVLPRGYVLPSVDDTQPPIARCKKLNGQERMAAYWIMKGGSRGQVSWKMEPLRGDLRSHIKALNHEAERRSTAQAVDIIVDGERLERKQPPPTTFIIHGHDHAGIKQLQDCFRKLKLPEPIIMKDELVRGATLPEKFEHLAGSAGRAIALLTPDDLGSSVSAPEPDRAPRARQNVWLEIGWFWGRSGRDHIMLLMRGDIEIPSDLRGLEYYKYDNNIEEEEVFDKIKKFLDVRLEDRG